MTNAQRKMMDLLGIRDDALKPKDEAGDIETALCELAEMLATQEEAIMELASLIGE